MRLLWLALIGGAGGFMVSGGMYALITTLGIINRFAQDTHTASQIILYEECVIWGATLGNVVSVTGKIVPVGIVGLWFFGLVAGIYAGCLAVALAEVIKTIPVYMIRIRLTGGIGYVILMMAIGKCVGGIIYFFVFYR